MIAIKKNINLTLQNIMDYLHNGWINLFSLSNRNCINILIIFTRFLNSQATRYLIIIGWKYNLVCFMHESLFDVNGDEQIILLQKKQTKMIRSL